MQALPLIPCAACQAPPTRTVKDIHGPQQVEAGLRTLQLPPLPAQRLRARAQRGRGATVGALQVSCTAARVPATPQARACLPCALAQPGPSTGTEQVRAPHQLALQLPHQNLREVRKHGVVRGRERPGLEVKHAQGACTLRRRGARQAASTAGQARGRALQVHAGMPAGAHRIGAPQRWRPAVPPHRSGCAAPPPHICCF